ncbi:MAG: hypothetical protein IJX21_05130 [Alistipes sp.]|nr:hypothetical protein [Alistipes sp.]
MKRFFRIFAAVALVCTTLVACEEKFDNYDPATPETTAQVYFSNEAATTINLAEVEAVEIPVMRAVNGAGITANITATVDAEYADVFTIPSSVTFADGETVANLVITFDREKIVYDETYAVSLQIAADMITDYGKDLINLNLKYPAPYESLGEGLFREDIMTTFYNVDNVEYKVEIFENLNTPGYVYLKNVYTSLYPYNEPGDYVTDDVYLAINVSNPDQVIIPRQKIGLNWGYGDVEIATAEYGTFKDGIITFPANGLLICMPEYNEGFYYANGSGKFRVVMPGTVMTDYSLNLAYSGIRVAADNSVRPVVDVVFGADVAEIQYAVVPGNISYDGEALAETLAGMFDESLVSATVAAADQTDDEEGLLQMELVGAEAVEPGIYSMVAVPYNADGEAQTADASVVAFYVNSVNTEIPEMDFNFMTMSANDLFAMFGEEGGFDESSSMAWFATGSNIKSWKMITTTAASVQAVLDKGATLKDIALANGSDWDLSYINGYGYDYNYYEGLAPATSYMVVSYVEDILGNETAIGAVYTTAPAAEADKQAIKSNVVKVKNVNVLVK